jgi:hypothetical protein
MGSSLQQGMVIGRAFSSLRRHPDSEFWEWGVYPPVLQKTSCKLLKTKLTEAEIAAKKCKIRQRTSVGYCGPGRVK